MVGIGRYFLAANRRLDALDGGEDHVGVGVAVAAGVFGQEPAAALGLHDRRADRTRNPFRPAARLKYSITPEGPRTSLHHRHQFIPTAPAARERNRLDARVIHRYRPTRPLRRDWRYFMPRASRRWEPGCPCFRCGSRPRGSTPSRSGSFSRCRMVVRIGAVPLATREADRRDALRGVLVLLSVACGGHLRCHGLGRRRARHCRGPRLRLDRMDAGRVFDRCLCAQGSARTRPGLWAGAVMGIGRLHCREPDGRPADRLLCPGGT